MTTISNLNRNSLRTIINKLQPNVLAKVSQTSKSFRTACKPILKSEKKKKTSAVKIQQSYRASQKRKFKKILNMGQVEVNLMLAHNHFPNNIEGDLRNNVIREHKLSHRQETLILKELIQYFIVKYYSPNVIKHNDKTINYILKTSHNKGLRDLNLIVSEYKRHFK